MFRVRSLTVRQFRGLIGTANFVFADRYHLVVGTNGGGKTNLLKLLAMLTQLDFSLLAGESFDFSWQGEWAGGGSIEGAVTRTQIRGSFPVWPRRLPKRLPVSKTTERKRENVVSTEKGRLAKRRFYPYTVPTA